MPQNHVRSDSAGFCVVCCEDIDIFAIGQCDHPICYVCSIRMRVLGKEKYCAVCRTDLDKVFFTKKCEKWATLQEQTMDGHSNNELGICYEDKEIRNKVNELLQYKCPKCLDKPPERTFNKLREHVRREHHLYFCEICFKHLQKFTYELKVYSRGDLVKHRRVGDAGDTAYKGHPLCEFCNERFLDNDHLHRHLRKNHFWCHFCEKDGKQLYFHDYVNLRVHFREEHYLCEEDMCKYEQYTSVFRSAIDLQAHVASKHTQKMSKAQVRQARQLEVDLLFNPQPNSQGRNITGQDFSEVRAIDHKSRQNRGKGRSALNNSQEDHNVQAAIEMSLSQNEHSKQALQENKGKENPSSEATHPILPEGDFPVLNEAVSVAKVCQSNSPKVSPTFTRKTEAFVKKVRGLHSLEDFPSLGNSTKTQQNGAGTNAQSSSGQFSPSPTRKTESFNKKAGSLDNLKDFPTLEKTASKSQQKGTNNAGERQGGTQDVFTSTRMPDASKTKNKAVGKVEDFSILGKPSKSMNNGGGTDSRSNSQIPTKTSHKPEAIKTKNTNVDNINDFPSLGRQSKTQQKGEGTSSNSSSEIQRKVTQKSEAFKPNNKAVDNVEDFPSLGKPTKSQLKTPPPGFSNVALKERSGLTQVKPPPGIQPNIPTPSVQPVILPKEEKKVVTNNAEKAIQLRNQNLIENIKALLNYDMEKFAEFKTLSGTFRQGKCSADTYYTNCTDLLGTRFTKIFNELVTLLPDKDKQKELLRIHNDSKVLAKENGKPIRQGAKRNANEPTIAWGASQSNVVPAKKEEGSQNIRNEADFPSLPSAAPRHVKPARIYRPVDNVSLKSAWVRGK